MKRISIGKLKLETRNSRDVFALFSALNAMGYDGGNNPKGMTPARKKVRKVLGGYDWSKKYPRLKRAIEKNHPWHLLNAILAKSKKIKKTSVLGGFISDFKKFFNEPLVRKLWRTLKARQVKEAKKLFPLFKKEASRLMAFINRPPKGIKKIVLITNPLDAYWRGYEFKIGKTGYVVVGPGAEKNHGELIRHEFLHLLAPAPHLPRRIIAGQRRNKRLAALGYGRSDIINREYVIRSLNLLYKSTILKMDVSEAIKREEKDFPRIREAVEFMKERKEKGRL